MRLHLAFVMAVSVLAGTVKAEERAPAARDVLEETEASESGEGSLCLGYDARLSVEELGNVLHEVATINAEISAVEGGGGIATVAYEKANPRELVQLRVAPEHQVEYALHRCGAGYAAPAGGVIDGVGIAALLGAGGLIGGILATTDDDGDGSPMQSVSGLAGEPPGGGPPGGGNPGGGPPGGGPPGGGPPGGGPPGGGPPGGGPPGPPSPMR